MNERTTKIKNDFVRFWQSRTKVQKGTIIGSLAMIILLAVLFTYLASRTAMVPLYSNVEPAEIGRIKETLDAQGVLNEIAPGGTSILVPEEQVDGLLVQLAAEGFPQSGNIDYSFFTENAGFGMTDNEFNVLKIASMQTELANLIKGVEGVNDAKVMLSLPQQSVFLNEVDETSSASIVLNTAPGQQFSEQQVTALYSLVSKSVPNLPEENIVITNQYFEYFDKESTVAGAQLSSQIELKKSIERDLQRQVQLMLGTMMGHNKVVVSVTTDVDFQTETREENLVLPVDEENMEGLAVSTQRITETYTGGMAAGGTPEGEDPTDSMTSYAEGLNGTGDYEKIEETVNNEMNRIRKEIVESPYKIRDIGLQVMVEPPDPQNPGSLPADVTDDIEQILETIIRTSIDKEAAGELTEEEVAEKVVVSVQQFNGKAETAEAEQPVLPWWIFAVGGTLLLIIGLMIFMMIRSRRRMEALLLGEQAEIIEIEDVNEERESDSVIRRKQLEKLAKDKPDEFAKLLRTWIDEE